MKIQELPDYPALQQLGRALWKTGKARGAAILVGAGFSRNADRIHANVPEPPLWSDIAAAMQDRLYPSENARRDPLRLAEEFKAVLGESALESLIRELVRDDEWMPGELHKALVRLPWTDILTTNWDTLLERAALENLGQTYETVRSIGDISTTRAPRVVKLHGSLPSNRPFILSEEDYRTYPRIFAPFVNLVQQTLLENELCLLGFSGDDPNFLEWSGWVRDQLGASARRIHLVGALDLNAAQRRLLESKNISAIDLGFLVDKGNTERHRTAASLFLKYLLDAQPRAPWDWPDTHNIAAARFSPIQSTPAQRIKDTLDTIVDWEQQRVAYPGWVVCPPQIRSRLQSDTIHASFSMKAVITDLAPRDRGRMVFETVWRLDTSFTPLVDGLRGCYEDIVRSEECWPDRDSRNVAARFLLRTAREERNAASFAEWLKYFDAQTSADPETVSSVLYERCLWASDELNFRELKQIVATLDGNDPVWKFRKAGLYCNIGDFRSARDAANTGLRQLRERFYRDRNSLWITSRLAWAKFLTGALGAWDSVKEDDPNSESEMLRLRFFEMKADPWETIKRIDMKIEEDLQKVAERKKGKEPQFKAGTYRDHSSTVYLGSWWPSESIYEISRICEVAGVPACGDHTNIMASRMGRAETLTEYKCEDSADYLRVLRVAQSQGDEFINCVFGRIQIGRVPFEICVYLDGVLTSALDFALEQSARREHPIDDYWIRRAAVYAEILSRLSVRFDESASLALFRTSLQYAQQPCWKMHELHKPLTHLLEQSFSSVSPKIRRTLISEVIAFPLPDEAGIGFPGLQDWPEPINSFSEVLITRPSDDSLFARRVAQLIEKTRDSDSYTRRSAACRLATLHFAGALTSDETTQFGDALWGRRKSEKDLPADTPFYSHMFLLLPSPDKEVTRDLLIERSHELSSSDNLLSIAAASRRRHDGSRGFVLSKDNALRLLDAFLAWKPKETPQIDFGGIGRENEACRRAMGLVLADAILPALSSDDLSTKVVEGCFGLVEDNVATTGAQALPELLRLDSSLLNRVVRNILKTMISLDNEKAWAGFNAIYRWANLTKDQSLLPVPESLIERVVFTVEACREPGLLHALSTSLQFINEKMLGPEYTERLAAALGPVFNATDYSDRESNDIGPITYTLVRAAAVRLADGLRKSGIKDDNLHWLQDHENDPMPEVRFALTDPEE